MWISSCRLKVISFAECFCWDVVLFVLAGWNVGDLAWRVHYYLLSMPSGKNLRCEGGKVQSPGRWLIVLFQVGWPFECGSPKGPSTE